MKKFALLLLALFALSAPAHAGTYWATVAMTTDSSGIIKGGVRHAALSTLKQDGYVVAVLTTNKDFALIRVNIADKDLPMLKTVAAKVIGKEGSRTPLSATLRAKLLAEAKRLGAPFAWQPTDYVTPR